MKQKIFYIFNWKFCLFKCFTDRLWNRAHGKLINLSPIHLGERIMLCTKLAVKIIHRPVLTMQCHATGSV